MTRIQTVALELGALILLSLSGAAQAQSDLKLGFVNMQYIVQRSPDLAAINQTLRTEFAERDSAFQALQKDYQDKLDKYNKDKDVMGVAERQGIERDLTQMQRDLERQGNSLQEDVQIRQQELLNGLQVDYLQKIRAFAELRDYDLIVTDAVYASPGVDITMQVFEAITGQKPSGDNDDE